MLEEEEEDGYRSSEDEDYVPEAEEGGEKKAKKAKRSTQNKSSVFASRRQRQGLASYLGEGDAQAQGGTRSSQDEGKSSSDLDDLFLRELGAHPSVASSSSNKQKPHPSAPEQPKQHQEQQHKQQQQPGTRGSAGAGNSERSGGFSLASLQRAATPKKKGVVPFRLPPDTAQSASSAATRTARVKRNPSQATDNTNSKSRQVKITKEVDFAGETVKIEKTVKEGSAVQRMHTAQEASKGAALESIMGMIDKKQSISTLTKSKMDWDQYKKQKPDAESQGPKSSYLEDVEFLERVDHRQHEQEISAKSRRR